MGIAWCAVYVYLKVNCAPWDTGLNLKCSHRQRQTGPTPKDHEWQLFSNRLCPSELNSISVLALSGRIIKKLPWSPSHDHGTFQPFFFWWLPKGLRIKIKRENSFCNGMFCFPTLGLEEPHDNNNNNNKNSNRKKKCVMV